MPALSICVIGLNEARYLERCFQSVRNVVGSAGVSYEVLYVDSGSADDSVVIASKYADVVGRLSGPTRRTASAGRNAAAALAAGQWILHIDGDMILRQEIAHQLPDIVRGELGSVVVGVVDDILPDGGRRLNAKGYTRLDTTTTHFGGAILIERSVLNDVGGWSPNLVSTEELDLYVRLRTAGYRVWVTSANIADHLGAEPRKSRRAKALLPYPLGPVRNLGFAQVVRLAIREGRARKLVRYYPKPFLNLAAFACFAFDATTRRVGASVMGVTLLALTTRGETKSRAAYHAVLCVQLMSIPWARPSRACSGVTVIHDFKRGRGQVPPCG